MGKSDSCMSFHAIDFRLLWIHSSLIWWNAQQTKSGEFCEMSHHRMLFREKISAQIQRNKTGPETFPKERQVNGVSHPLNSYGESHPKLPWFLRDAGYWTEPFICHGRRNHLESWSQRLLVQHKSDQSTSTHLRYKNQCSSIEKHYCID